MTNLKYLSTRSLRQINKTARLNLKGLLAFWIGLLSFACDTPAVYDQYQAIENTSWEKDKEYYFTFEVEDPTTPYDLTLEIRNNNLYPYQNLWLFCNEEQPIGPLKRDTLECLLADEFGKWHGRGISLFQSSFPIRRHYYFPHEGQYTFSFRQGMRREALPGIQEIGLRVEKSQSSTLLPGSVEPEEDK